MTTRTRFGKLAMLTICLAGAGMLVAQEVQTNDVAVATTFNHRPFSYRLGEETRRTGCRVIRLTYPSAVTSALPQNNTVPAMLFLPSNLKLGEARRPAVICLPILNGDEGLTEMMCSVLVARGIPAIMFTLPYYGARGPAEGRRALANDPKVFLAAIEQAQADIRRAADLLASRPEIDPQRLGIAGISLGGIMAGTAAGGDARFYRASLLLAGGDLVSIIHHTRETRQLSAMIQRLPAADRASVEAGLQAMDPLTHAVALRERARLGRVQMINAGADEVIPRECTEKLAEALGISQQVVWFDGLGHYTAMAELPRALKLMADFFAQDLPPGAKPVVPAAGVASTPLERVMCFAREAVAMATVMPSPGHAHFLQGELAATNQSGRVIAGQARLAIGEGGQFALWVKSPQLGEVEAGQGEVPWLFNGKETYVGTRNPSNQVNALSFLVPQTLMQYRVAAGAAAGVTLVPEMAQRWIKVEADERDTNGNVVRITAREVRKAPYAISLEFRRDAVAPAGAEFTIAGYQGRLRLQAWQTNTIAVDLFRPYRGAPTHEVAQTDLQHMFAALLNFAAERLGSSRAPEASNGLAVVARDPAGHGLLCRLGRKTILMVDGTPAEMGAAQGFLSRDAIRRTVERVVYGVGVADTVKTGAWFPDTLAAIERRVQPHLPPRFFAECDALADAAGLTRQEVRFANLFPERFHCSGVALRGKATVGGQVLHARVLDYMRDIGLQDSALVIVFMPREGCRWMSLGYAGFLGTVTAMNEKGVAIGEMGGRGEGQWDGVPMSFLLRDVMERAATAEEAVAILRQAPRTCEYYYVISDRSGALRALHCLPEKVEILEPGQQHPLLPPVPQDAVYVSGGDRAKELSQRLTAQHGTIDAPRLMEIIKRPVAMRSNLHNAIFAPQTLEMWFADAGRDTPACDEPYTHVKLDELIRFYAETMGRTKE